MLLTAAGQADIVGSQHEDLEVHDLAEPLFQVGMDPLKDYNWRSFHSAGDGCALVQGEVVGGDLAVVSRHQLIQLLERQIKVKGCRVIEVVVGSIIVLVIAAKKKISRLERVCCALT